MRRALLLFAVFGLVGLARAADPRVGVWKLNAAKSKFPVEVQTIPKDATIVIRELGSEQLEFALTGTRRNGSPISEKFREPQQGGVVTGIDPVPAQGRVLIHTVIGPGDFYSTILQDGKQIAVWHWVVSKDFKTMLVTIRGTDAQGKSYQREALYERQQHWGAKAFYFINRAQNQGWLSAFWEYRQGSKSGFAAYQTMEDRQ